MTPRDQPSSSADASPGEHEAKKSAECRQARHGQAPLRDGEAEGRRRHAGDAGGPVIANVAPNCAAKAGDCDAAYVAYKDGSSTGRT